MYNSFLSELSRLFFSAMCRILREDPISEAIAPPAVADFHNSISKSTSILTPTSDSCENNGGESDARPTAHPTDYSSTTNVSSPIERIQAAEILACITAVIPSAIRKVNHNITLLPYIFAAVGWDDVVT